MIRFIDILLSFVLALILLPVILLVALLVRFTSPGRILYAQTRVGLHGKPFTLYKFRTMVPGADRMGSSVTARGDARITPLGRLLRRTKLDELPQLWNVLCGDMSLVGPRPEVPEIVAHYTPDQSRILDVPPGITGVASLYLCDEEQILAALEDPDEGYLAAVVPFKLSLAMAHVQRRSMLFDFKILLLTIYAVTLGRWWPLQAPTQVEAFKRDLLDRYGKRPEFHESQ